MSAGIVLRRDDAVARAKAGKCGVAIEVRQDWALPWERTLFIAPGTCVPWDLIAVGFEFLARWDVAAPFWRAGVLAKHLGMPAERERTEAVIHDLRVQVYSFELLFVRASEAGRAMVDEWRKECADGCDERLAFVRALYIIKPRFCVLPRLWLADIEQRATGDRMAAQQRNRARSKPLVTIEIQPGRFVKCHQGDEAKVREHFAQLDSRRRRIQRGG